jgi:CubicO group peptidase (beta-lactamase class C family)
MLGRREFLGASTLGLIGGWAGNGRGQEPAPAKTKPSGTVTRKALRPVLPAEPSPALSLRADERINRGLAATRDRHEMPGMIGAVVKGASLAAIGAAGVRKLGSEEPIGLGDRVHLGSDTKAMTATLAGMLVDEGKLGWSSSIGEVFPDLATSLHPDYRAVTLLQLLNHRAGLPHDGPWRRPGRGLSTTRQRRELLARMLKDAPQTKPGTTYSYSTVGYALAGLMAEQVTGQPWEDLMRSRLFEPLAMDTAGFGPPGTPGRIDEPWGHREADGKVEPVQSDNAPAMDPAGTVHASVPDWARFVALHLQGARGRSRLLKLATFRVLHTPPPGSEYAGGWFVVDRPWAGGRALMHSGSNTTWYATVWIAPARNFAVLVATNRGGDAAREACDAAIAGLIPLAERLKGPGPSRSITAGR